MKDQDKTSITFVNTVLGRGIFNHVVNLTFGALNFTPSDDGKTIDSDHVVACRLRMDMECARALHAELGVLLDMIPNVDPGRPADTQAPEKKAEKPARVKVN